MKKDKHERQKYRIIEVYAVLILIAALFMEIGYASVSGIAMSISGNTATTEQDGVIITDVTYVKSEGADITNSKINFFLQTMLESEVVLGNTTSSTIKYEVKVYNKTDKKELVVLLI